jgi:hypothetical protein
VGHLIIKSFLLLWLIATKVVIDYLLDKNPFYEMCKSSIVGPRAAPICQLPDKSTMGAHGR